MAAIDISVSEHLQQSVVLEVALVQLRKRMRHFVGVLALQMRVDCVDAEVDLVERLTCFELTHRTD